MNKVNLINNGNTKIGRLNKIEINNNIEDLINRQLPPQLIMKKPMGGNKQALSYISGSTVTDMLNAAFGVFGWSSEILEQWMEPGIPFLNKYKNDTLEPQNPVAFVKIRLTVKLVDDNGNIIECHKDSFGSKAVIGKQSEQESTYKAAQTDALKKAASLFGIGLQLYRKEEEQQHFNELNIKPTWTPENIEAYKESYEYIKAIIDADNEEYVNQCVAFLTNGEVSSFDYIPLNKVKPLREMIIEALNDAQE